MLIPSKPQMTWNNAVSDEPKHKNSQITGFNQITYGAATKLTVGVGRHRRWSLIIMLLSIWGHQAKKKKERKKGKERPTQKGKTTTTKKPQSHRPNTYLEATQGTTKTKANHWSISSPCYTAYWPADRASPHSSDERQAQSMMPKIERLLIPSNKRKDEKSNTNAYGRKGRERKRMYTNACGKERKNKPQMPRAKKERPNHKRWWQTKNGCPNQASKRKTAALIRQANEKWLP